LKKKGEGREAIVKTTTRVKMKWTRYELGLVDENGDTRKCPVMEILSKGKGPGTNNIRDMKLMEDEHYRSEMLQMVYEVMNEGRKIEKEWLKCKLMLISKTGEATVDQPHELRMISIQNIENKLIQCTILHLM